MGQEQSTCASREPHARRRAGRPATSTPDAAPLGVLGGRLSSRHSSTDLDLKSDNSSTESSGYRSGSSGAYEYRSASERPSSSDYYHLSLYKNDHYKDINRELYRPVKIAKDKRHRLQLLNESDADRYRDKRLSIEGYLSAADTLRSGGASDAKKCGIRNYTPKILSDEEQKRIENWI